MRAYRSGDLYLALANFDLAIDLDPGLPDSYIDRGIVFHRLGDLKRALSDVAEAKRIDDLNRNQSACGLARPKQACVAVNRPAYDHRLASRTERSPVAMFGRGEAAAIHLSSSA